MREIEVGTPPVNPPERVRRLASWLLNQARVIGNRSTAAAFGPGNRTDYAVLAALQEFGPSSQAAIGLRLGIDRSDLVALLNRLGAAELVRRAPDPSDRRRNTVTITTAGRDHLEAMDAAVDHAQDQLLAPLDPAERATLVALLQRVVAHHHGGGDAPRP